MNDEKIVLREEAVVVEELGDGEIVVEEVEIEIYAKRGEPIPAAQRYIIRVDKEKLTLQTHTIKGREILALVKKTPDKYKLYQQHHKQQPALVEPEQVVDLRRHHIERFTTMPRDTTEGSTHAALDLRHQFTLPTADTDYLDRLALPWEAVRDNNTLWLLIHDWSVPRGYNVSRVSVALLIPTNYSDGQIDMVYFKPALARADGRAIGALTTQLICGETWQRWSRHRTQENPWRAGVDDVATHLTLVDEWLRREFQK
jgi:hypothetical protein